MIFKIQRSLYTQEDEPQVLIYNKSGNVQWQGPATKEILKHFKSPNEYKIYCNGFILDGEILLQNRIKHQKW